MVKHLVYPGKCSMCIWEECIYCYCSVEVSEFAMKTWWFILLFKHSVSLLRFSFSCFICFESGILKSPNIVIGLFPSFFSCQYCFKYVWVLFLGAYMFMLVMLFWWIFSIIIKSHSSSLEAFFALMSLFSVVQFFCGYSLQVVSDCLHIWIYSGSPLWDFPGGPVAKTTCSQWQGPRFDPCQETRSHMLQLSILMFPCCS